MTNVSYINKTMENIEMQGESSLFWSFASLVMSGYQNAEWFMHCA